MQENECWVGGSIPFKRTPLFVFAVCTWPIESPLPSRVDPHSPPGVGVCVVDGVSVSAGFLASGKAPFTRVFRQIFDLLSVSRSLETAVTPS